MKALGVKCTVLIAFRHRFQWDTFITSTIVVRQDFNVHGLVSYVVYSHAYASIDVKTLIYYFY